jgi:hypothetical protein
MPNPKLQISSLKYPLLAVSLLTVLAAMWAGLMRLGWGLPALTATLAGTHGPLIISGFLGTLINLERVVALNRRGMYAAPAVTALGALVTFFIPGPAGPALLTLGSLGMVMIFAVIVRMHPALHTITMALGAAAWLAGNTLWLAGLPIYRIVFWWGAFLILTIAGERLEMSRVMRTPRLARIVFACCLIPLLVGLILMTLDRAAGWRVTGAATLALAVWLLRYDIVQRTVKQTGLTRFIALNLLIGFLWLGVSGALLMAYGKVMAGPRYDAALHTLLLGFVFGMIFGHAPIILPAVLGVPMTYSSSFYSHWALLHLSLIVRIVGDAAHVFPLRQWGGMFNVIAVLLFLFNTARTIALSHPRETTRARMSRGAGV